MSTTTYVFMKKLEVAEWLGLPTSDHEVLCSNLTGGRIQLMIMVLYCTEPFISTLLSSQYDLNNAERDVNHQGPVVQNLTKLLANMTLKFLYWNMTTHIFAAKNFNVFENTLATTVNKFVINMLVKLTML